METIACTDLTAERLHELHRLANRLAAEDVEHFAAHAETCTLVNVFRRADTGEIVGFQFWTTVPIDLPRSHIIAGGKLRMLPEFRNRGLHLLAGLEFFLRTKLRHPLTRYYRVSLASIFGFVSLTGSLAEYTMFGGPREPRALREAVIAWARRSDFVFRPESGLFFVDIFTTEETLRRYPDSFFEKPGARAYIAANPEFRTNGSYVAFWFRFTPRNLLAMCRAIARKL